MTSTFRKKPKERYSLLRAIRLAADHKAFDGLEGEVSAEIAKQTGKPPRGFYMPHTAKAQRYDVTTSTAAGLTQTVTEYSEFYRPAPQ